MLGVKRRDFITLLGGAATWPIAARGQQSTRLVGLLGSGLPAAYRSRIAEFRRSLRETGYIEGQNVSIKQLWAENNYDRLRAMAAELARRRVDVIVTDGGPSAPAARAETSTIPIIFAIGADPVEAGLVTSLNRPGGNLTGATSLSVELGPKRLELLHDLLPTVNTIPVLLDPDAIGIEAQFQSYQAAAHDLGVRLTFLHANSRRDLDEVFSSLGRLRPGALMISGSAFFRSQSSRLAELSIRHAIPSSFNTREFALSGGLMSYGDRGTDLWRIAGAYAGRILNGAKPADLPVQQVTNIELVINLKTAKRLGLTIPLSLRARADEIIE
jgi:putative ABC transport system substrate-binding protein